MERGKSRLIKAVLTTLAAVLALTAVLAASGCKKTDKGPRYPRVNIAPPALTPQPEPDDAGEEVKFSVNRTLSSDMVVQRNSYFNVFGTSESASGVIYGEFMGEKRSAAVGSDGRWSMQFSSHEANAEPQTLKLYTKHGESKELTGILIGDVWVISGQSNAELGLGGPLTKTPEYAKEIKKTDNIRIYRQTRQAVMDVQEKGTVDVTVPQDDVVDPSWHWEHTTVSTTNFFSAIGYYFAKELSRTVDVPLGIVMAASGGSTLHELMPAELARSLGFNAGASVPEGGFYNTLLHPFIRNSITGMIFYQGESECAGGQYNVYARNLARTVEAYRNDWKLEFPFINVQLSTHLGDGLTYWPELPRLRMAQFDAYRQIPNSYIVAAMDQGWQKGDADWAHPLYKYELGRRAAKIAAYVSYGQGDEEHALAPEPDKITWEDGKTVVIKFKHVGDGLKLMDGGDKIKGLTIVDEYGDRLATEAEFIDGSTIRLVTFSADAKAVAYCLDPNGAPDNANLASSDGIAMPAFLINR